MTSKLTPRFSREGPRNPEEKKELNTNLNHSSHSKKANFSPFSVYQIIKELEVPHFAWMAKNFNIFGCLRCDFRTEFFTSVFVTHVRIKGNFMRKLDLLSHVHFVGQSAGAVALGEHMPTQFLEKPRINLFDLGTIYELHWEDFRIFRPPSYLVRQK